MYIAGAVVCTFVSEKLEIARARAPMYVPSIEILGLEGESTNEKWTINPCRQGKLDLGVGNPS
jgi:hypothetical protein